MKVLVCGDRNWTDTEKIREKLEQLPVGTIVVHGACRGADEIADEEAKKLGFGVLPYPYIRSLGKAGGPVRNQKMLDENRDITRCLAFHPNLDNSKGTADMVRRCWVRGVPVEIVK